MDSKVSYTAVGLFVIVLAATGVLIFLWLSSMKNNRFTKTYLTYMREDVSGLNLQSNVRFNGVKVGYVANIELDKTDAQQVKVTLKLAENTPVTTSTVAALKSEGITGIEYIGLKALSSNAPKLVAQPGKQYPEIPSQPSLLFKLTNSVQEVTKSITELTKDVRLVFDEKNRKEFSKTLENVREVTGTLANNSKQIDSSLKSIDTLLQNGAKASEDFPRISKQLQSTLKEIQSAAQTVQHTGVSVSNTMETTQSSFRQIAPEASGLIHRLNILAGTLQKVGDEMQQNPAIIIRGTVPAAPGPGEK